MPRAHVDMHGLRRRRGLGCDSKQEPPLARFIADHASTYDMHDLKALPGRASLDESPVNHFSAALTVTKYAGIALA